MKSIVLFLAAFSVCYARPPNRDFSPRNVVTVPPNCGPNQQLINGVCTDVWIRDDLVLQNVVTVPPNCNPGQQLINGACTDVWIRHLQIEDDENPRSRNVVDIPNQCPQGHKPDGLGICRPLW